MFRKIDKRGALLANALVEMNNKLYEFKTEPSTQPISTDVNNDDFMSLSDTDKGNYIENGGRVELKDLYRLPKNLRNAYFAAQTSDSEWSEIPLDHVVLMGKLAKEFTPLTFKHGVTQDANYYLLNCADIVKFERLIQKEDIVSAYVSALSAPNRLHSADQEAIAHMGSYPGVAEVFAEDVMAAKGFMKYVAHLAPQDIREKLGDAAGGHEEVANKRTWANTIMTGAFTSEFLKAHPYSELEKEYSKDDIFTLIYLSTRKVATPNTASKFREIVSYFEPFLSKSPKPLLMNNNPDNLLMYYPEFMVKYPRLMKGKEYSEEDYHNALDFNHKNLPAIQAIEKVKANNEF
jgi:hypothetical protein